MPPLTVTPQVIIIGTGHKLQAGHNSYTSSQLEAFTNYIDTTREKYQVKFIAEEMSNDMLPSFGVTATLAKTLADNIELEHRYIDLSIKERNDLGIDHFALYQIGQSAKFSKEQLASLEKTIDELRECVWLVRVLDTNIWPVLIICGANHAPRLQYLFHTMGIPTVIEVNDYNV